MMKTRVRGETSFSKKTPKEREVVETDENDPVTETVETVARINP